MNPSVSRRCLMILPTLGKSTEMLTIPPAAPADGFGKTMTAPHGVCLRKKKKKKKKYVTRSPRSGDLKKKKKKKPRACHVRSLGSEEPFGLFFLACVVKEHSMITRCNVMYVCFEPHSLIGRKTYLHHTRRELPTLCPASFRFLT